MASGLPRRDDGDSVHRLALGRALRRFRRLNGMKQAHAAELFGVSQGSVSRWEAGDIQPGTAHRLQIENLLATPPDSNADRALRILVQTSTRPVHLVCNATHRLLAVSQPRLAQWRVSISEYIGRSLWPFASAEIVAAEQRLSADWHEAPGRTLTFATSANGREDIRIVAGTMRWDTIALSNGQTGRLSTAVQDRA